MQKLVERPSGLLVPVDAPAELFSRMCEWCRNSGIRITVCRVHVGEYVVEWELMHDATNRGLRVGVTHDLLRLKNIDGAWSFVVARVQEWLASANRVEPPPKPKHYFTVQRGDHGDFISCLNGIDRAGAELVSVARCGPAGGILKIGVGYLVVYRHECQLSFEEKC